MGIHISGTIDPYGYLVDCDGRPVALRLYILNSDREGAQKKACRWAPYPQMQRGGIQYHCTRSGTEWP
jgi:hypothetical protein